jgi:cytochrome c oxidase subunit 3
MPAFSPPAIRKPERPSTGRGGGLHPPAFGGGGSGDNRPDDSSPDYGRRLNRARLALLLGIVSISVLFVTLTTVLFVLRHSTVALNGHKVYAREWVEVALPIRLLVLNTFVLLLSSFTIEMARRAVTREMVLAPVRTIPGIATDRERGTPWLAITIALGLIFLTGQWMAWNVLQAHGFSVHSSTSSSFVYILTASHAVHLAGGIMVLLYAGAISWLHRAIEHRRIVIEVASWYWHFMGALWIYIFALLQFGR